MAYYVPVDKGPDQTPLDAFEPSFGMSLSSAVRGTFNENASTLLYDVHDVYYQNRFGGRKLDKATAEQQVKDAGVSLQVPDDGYTPGALSILIKRQQDIAARQSVDERTPWGFGSLVRGSAQLLTGVVDPLNVASAFIPFVGEARATKWIADAGESALARATTRAGIGAIEGAGGAAVLEPLVYTTHHQLQDDYRMQDSLINLAFGTALGGILHPAAGAVADVFRPRVRTADLPDTAAAHVVDRLAPEVHETAVRSAIADSVQGRTPDVESWVKPIDAEARAANFKAWSQDAPLIPAMSGHEFKTGVPVVADAFHGTTREFDAFSSSTLGEKTGGADAKEGHFLSDNPNAADQFTWENGDKSGHIMPAYVRLLNPLVSDHALSGATGTAAGKIIAEAKAAGHDGVIFQRSDMLGNKGATFVAFDPKQIKSAIGNSGKFDPNSASLTDPLDAARASTQRQRAPDSLAIGDPAASRAADERIAAAPKSEDVEAATAQLTDAAEQLQAIRKNLELGGIPPEKLAYIDEAMKAFDGGVTDAKNIGEAIMQNALCGLRS